MAATPASLIHLSLISRSTTLALLGALALAALLLALPDLSGSWNDLGVVGGYLLAAAALAALAAALQLHQLGVMTTQRLAVGVLCLCFLGSLADLWLVSGRAVDVHTLARAYSWLLVLDALLFLSLPRRVAVVVAALLAVIALAIAWWSPLKAAEASRQLALELSLAHVVLVAINFGLAVQFGRLLRSGHPGMVSAGSQGEQSVKQLVNHREAALRQLLEKSEHAHLLAGQREAELRTMLEAFPGFVLRVKDDGSIGYCNKNTAALLDLSAAELQGRPASELLGLTEYRRSCTRSLEIASTGRPLSYECSLRSPHGGQREWLMTQLELAGDETEPGVTYFIGVDIGERKQAEAALASAKAAAEEANRAKSRFMSSMSYELRTPLNAVLGLAQMMRVQVAQDSQQHIYLKAIADAGKDLLTLVDETLDLSRMETGEMRVSCQPVELAELVRNVLFSLKPDADLQRVLLAPAPSLRGVWVQADSVRLRQVLVNLLSNAIKYNRPGGGVAVRVLRRGAEVQLVVQDTGTGMSEAQQAQLFQPFNRLGAERSAVPGTGIGLSISHSLVVLMGGRMDVRSQVGVGSEFMVWLAAVPAPPQPTQLPQQSNFGALDERLEVRGSVLYVEDNQVNVLVFEACLSRRPGVKLHVAGSGAQALKLLQHTAVDVVVLDLNLPDQTGLELADSLRQQPHTARTSLVMLTADATAHTAQRAREHGVERIWHKPFDAARLLRELDQMLDRVPEMA